MIRELAHALHAMLFVMIRTVLCALVGALVAVGCSHGRSAATSTISGLCGSAPTGREAAFEHRRSELLARMTPRHRGVDLIAVETDESQTLGGKLAYGPSDKDLEDEAVDVYACMDNQWQSIGGARTDSDGRFTMTLADDRRLPAGMRDLYAHVPGDRSGTRFLAYVAKPDESVIVTDIDGTITASEDAIWATVLRGKDIDHQPHAPETLAASGKVVVYVTARGDQLTEVTRDWLANHGFPRGPLRLAPSLAVLPGTRTAAYKASTLRDVRVPIAAGIGNRRSDIAAYDAAGVSSQQIFINLPEFTDEVTDELAAKKAVGFDEYREIHGRL